MTATAMTSANSIAMHSAKADSLLPGGMRSSFFKLDNGLQIYVIENHSAPVFTYQTWFRVGSKDESAAYDKTGLAHLFEHMMFRGTPKFPEGQFDDLMTRHGGTHQNATTWLDRTNYYESLPSDQLELAMTLESDRMANLQFTDQLLATEKDVVLGEYRMGLDDPYLQGSELLYATAFTKHPYRYSTIGTEQEIKGFTPAEAKTFYGRFYSPSNATLLIVGDVDPAKVSALATQYYGAYSGKATDHPVIPVEPPQTAERQAEYQHAQLQDPKLFIGYHTPAATDADIPALWVLDSLLSSGRASILEDVWVNAGLAVDASVSLDQFSDPGLFTITADVQESHQPRELLGALDRALTALNTATDLPAQVERAKNQLLLSVYRSYDENQSLASFIGESIAAAGDPIYAFDLVHRVGMVTASDVLRVAGKYLVASNRTTVIGSPK